MHHIQFTISRLLLLIAALGVTLASLQGNHVWFMGISIMTVVGFLGAAIGVETSVGRPGPTTPYL